ncbi:hypothetical protein LCGC14_1295180, partial [marine sediment metagenome]
MAPETEKHLVKYLLNEASAEDLDALSDWILVDSNEQIFETFVRSHYETTTTMNEPDTDKIKKVLKRRMMKDNILLRRRKIPSLMKYAAVGLVFLALGYFVQRNQTMGNHSDRLVRKQEAITITFDNGTIENL